MNIADKVKANSRRPAEIEGAEIFVKVYSLRRFKDVAQGLQGENDAAIAAVLAAQFENEDGTPAFPAEFLLSDDCPQCFIAELAQLFAEVNTGVYAAKKKAKLPLA